MSKTLAFASGELTINTRPLIMGIINLTPDSFSDGGKFTTPSKALQKALSLEEDGADILDLGAVSTAPGAKPVSGEEERARLIPSLRLIRANTSIPLSVDTFDPETARIAFDEGADIVNDVSGCLSEDMACVVRSHNAAWIMTHFPGKDSGETAVFDSGVTASVSSFFKSALEFASRLGIPSERIVLDPGFGFAKSAEDDLDILRDFASFKRFGTVLLAGISRKRSIGRFSETPDPVDRDAATLAADMLAVCNGADIVRVHEVASHKKAFDILEVYGWTA